MWTWPTRRSRRAWPPTRPPTTASRAPASWPSTPSSSRARPKAPSRAERGGARRAAAARAVVIRLPFGEAEAVVDPADGAVVALAHPARPGAPWLLDEATESWHSREHRWGECQDSVASSSSHGDGVLALARAPLGRRA